MSSNEYLEIAEMYKSGNYYAKEIMDKFALYPYEFKKIIEKLKEMELV